MPISGSNSQDPMIGVQLAGKYKIKELIGQGAMGRVYLAIQESIDRQVAIKILHQHLMEDRRVAKRFAREAQAASRFNHPNSISIIDFGQTEHDSLYIAMEYITGSDLADIISRDAPLAVDRTVRIAVQVLSALQLAHSNNIIHRDLKPENIMLAEGMPGHKDFVKVCDFGIAKIQQPAGDNRESALTMFGMICGTPYYMSPEQAKGEELDGRSDLYSMGIILYEMLTGKVPFLGSTPVEVIARHLTDLPVPPSKSHPELNIPRAIEKVIMMSLSKKREDRFDCAQKMSEAIERALKEAEFQADLQRVLNDADTPVIVGTPLLTPARGEQIRPPIASPARATNRGAVASFVPPVQTVGSAAIVEDVFSLSRPPTPSPASIHSSLSHQPFAHTRTPGRQKAEFGHDTPLPQQALRSPVSVSPRSENLGETQPELTEMPTRRSGKLWLWLTLICCTLGAVVIYVYLHRHTNFFQPTSNNGKPDIESRDKPELRRDPTIPHNKGIDKKPVEPRVGLTTKSDKIAKDNQNRTTQSGKKSNISPSAKRDREHLKAVKKTVPSKKVKTTVTHTHRIKKNTAKAKADESRDGTWRVATISIEAQRYTNSLNFFNNWIKKEQISIRDLNSQQRNYLNNAKRTAAKNNHAQAIKYLALLNGMQHKIPVDVMQNKLKRIENRYKTIRQKLSPKQDENIRKTILSAQNALLNGSTQQANLELNRVMAYMRSSR